VRVSAVAIGIVALAMVGFVIAYDKDLVSVPAGQAELVIVGMVSLSAACCGSNSSTSPA